MLILSGGGDPEKTFSLDVTRVDGHSFSNRFRILLPRHSRYLNGQVPFQGPEAAPSYSPRLRWAASECRSALEIFRSKDHPAGVFGKTAAFDVRHIGQSLYTKADPQKLLTAHQDEARAEIPPKRLSTSIVL